MPKIGAKREQRFDWSSVAINGTPQHFNSSFISYLTMNSFVETMTKQHIWESDEWKALQEAVPGIKEQHLRQLLQVNSIPLIHVIGRKAF